MIQFALKTNPLKQSTILTNSKTMRVESSLCSLIISTIAGVLSYKDVWSFLIGFPAILPVKYSTTMAVRYEEMMDLDRKINLWLSNKAAVGEMGRNMNQNSGMNVSSLVIRIPYSFLSHLLS